RAVRRAEPDRPAAARRRGPAGPAGRPRRAVPPRPPVRDRGAAADRARQGRPRPARTGRPGAAGPRGGAGLGGAARGRAGRRRPPRPPHPHRARRVRPGGGAARRGGPAAPRRAALTQAALTHATLTQAAPTRAALTRAAAAEPGNGASMHSGRRRRALRTAPRRVPERPKRARFRDGTGRSPPRPPPDLAVLRAPRSRPAGFGWATLGYPYLIAS